MTAAVHPAEGKHYQVVGGLSIEIKRPTRNDFQMRHTKLQAKTKHEQNTEFLLASNVTRQKLWSTFSEAETAVPDDSKANPFPPEQPGKLV